MTQATSTTLTTGTELTKSQSYSHTLCPAHTTFPAHLPAMVKPEAWSFINAWTVLVLTVTCSGKILETDLTELVTVHVTLLTLRHFLVLLMPKLISRVSVIILEASNADSTLAEQPTMSKGELTKQSSLSKVSKKRFDPNITLTHHLPNPYLT